MRENIAEFAKRLGIPEARPDDGGDRLHINGVSYSINSFVWRAIEDLRERIEALEEKK